jgi:hypothetical protein
MKAKSILAFLYEAFTGWQPCERGSVLVLLLQIDALMLRTSQADRTQVIVASGIVSAILAILLLMLAYQPW